MEIQPKEKQKKKRTFTFTLFFYDVKPNIYALTLRKHNFQYNPSKTNMEKNSYIKHSHRFNAIHK